PPGAPSAVAPAAPSGSAAPAPASIPATMRGVNRAVIFAAGYGAEEADVDWAALARTGEPIILYMPMHHLETIANALLRGGASPHTPTAVNCSTPTKSHQGFGVDVGHISEHH